MCASQLTLLSLLSHSEGLDVRRVRDGPLHHLQRVWKCVCVCMRSSSCEHVSAFALLWDLSMHFWLSCLESNDAHLLVLLRSQIPAGVSLHAAYLNLAELLLIVVERVQRVRHCPAQALCVRRKERIASSCECVSKGVCA